MPIMNFFLFHLESLAPIKKRGSSDELGKKSSFKKINCVLKVENMPKEINYIMAMDVFVAFGRIDRIKKVWQAHNKTNTYYLF